MLSPLVTTATFLQMKLKYGRKDKFENQLVDDYEKANALLFDVIINYKTVITFGQKNIDKITERFELLLESSSSLK